MLETDSPMRKQRNLFVHVPLDKKDKLKTLAAKSGMSLEAYVAAVLCEAVKNKDEFTYTKKEGPALAS